MIIQLRGTSGSGKTTIVKAIMTDYTGIKSRVMVSDRKQPIGYILQRGVDQPAGRPLAVIGHYETACGGCDTIKTADEVYSRMAHAHELGFDVLFEGLLLSGEINRTMDWVKDHQGFYHTAFIDTELEECLASINLRRAARGKLEPVARTNTESKFKAMVNVERRLREQLPEEAVFKGDRAAVLDWCRKIFNAHQA